MSISISSNSIREFLKSKGVRTTAKMSKGDLIKLVYENNLQEIFQKSVRRKLNF